MQYLPHQMIKFEMFENKVKKVIKRGNSVTPNK